MSSSITISRAEWEAVHTMVGPFIGDDELVATGHVRLVADGSARRWIATDGYRLAVLHGGPDPEQLAVSLPGRLITAAIALAQDETTLTVERALSDGSPHSVVLRVSDTTEVHLPAGPDDYPDVLDVANPALDRPTLDMRVSRPLLLELVQQGRLMPTGAAIDDDDAPLFWLHVAEDHLDLVVDWGEYGLSRFRLGCDAEGETSLPVNPLFLEEFLAAVPDEIITVSFPADRRGPLRMAAASWDGYLVPIDATPEQYRPRVEELLARMGVAKLVRDPDGDYPFRFGSADLYVRLPPDEPARVQVFSVVLRDVPDSDGLLRELNDYNANLPFVRAFWFEDQVVVEIEQLAETLDVVELANACGAVVTAAQDLGPVLADFFGGTVAFDDEAP